MSGEIKGQSGIEWCGETWEVTAGCTMVSSGCANCYAETLVAGRLCGSARRRRADGKGIGEHRSAVDVSLEVINPKTKRWNGEVRELAMNLDEPIRRKTPTVYFVNSRSDLFHEGVDFSYIDRVFAVMALCPQHRFLVLTKRPERMREYLTESGSVGHRIYQQVQRWLDLGGTGEGFFTSTQWDDAHRLCGESTIGSGRIEHTAWKFPLPNVWLGTSVEDQAACDARVPELLACPVGEGAGRFISAEPLLGDVDLGGSLRGSTRVHMCMDVRGAIRNKSFDGLQHDDGTAMTRREAEEALWDLHASGVKVIPMGSCDDFDDQKGCRGHPKPRVNWVIVGGESGKDARIGRLGWIRSVVEQCRGASVPVFVKQMGSVCHDFDDDRAPCAETKVGTGKGNEPSEWPEDLQVREVPGGLRIGDQS